MAIQYGYRYEFGEMIPAPADREERRQPDAIPAMPRRKPASPILRSISSTQRRSKTSRGAVADALADYELALGNKAPSGTYLDMASHMPMVDPKKIQCPFDEALPWPEAESGRRGFVSARQHFFCHADDVVQREGNPHALTGPRLPGLGGTVMVQI